jgi:hypothetical protein
MLLITITNWKRKGAVVVKLLLFLLLIGLIIPQFLSYIAGEIGDIENQQDLMQVETDHEQQSDDKPALDKMRQLEDSEIP